MKNLIIVFTLLLITFEKTNAQKDSVENNTNKMINVNVDLMNRYVWRGIDFGNTPCVQPSITYNYKNFNIGSWASTSTTGSFTEIDLYSSYTLKNITLQLTDFFFPYDSLTNNNSYFNYKNSNTGHTLEVGIKYENQKLPFSIGIYSFIYGYDPKPLSTDKYFSTYIELGYSFSLNDVDCELKSGITPQEGFYANKFSFVNIEFIAKKKIPITPTFSLPLKVALITNPKNENIYLTFGFTL